MSRSGARPARVGLVGLVGLAGVVAGCASSGDGDGPLVSRVDDAMFAVESYYAAPQDYFQISADPERVEVVVALDDGGAERSYWSPGDGIDGPEPISVPFTDTFDSGDLEFDPGKVLGRIADELPDSEIVDFAITASGGRAVYDATVRSERGGRLLVLLGPDGDILGTRDA